MNERQTFGCGGVLVAVALLAGLTTLYVVGYFVQGTNVPGPQGPVRVYPTYFIARFYFPLAFVEAKTTRREVLMTDRETEGFDSYLVEP